MYVCFICDITLSSYKFLVHHVSKNHVLSSCKQLTCKQNGCLRVFQSAKSLYRHIRVSHATNVSLAAASGLVGSKVSIEPFEETRPDAATLQYGLSENHAGSGDEEMLEDDESLSDMYDIDEIAYILKMFAQPNLNRKNIFTIVESTKALLESKIGTESNSFKNLETEHKLQKALSKLNLWLQPTKFVLNYVESVSKIQGKDSVKMRSVDCEVFSLKDLFKMILEVPHILEIAKQNMSSKTDSLNDIKDAHLLKDLPKDCFPYILFYDEVETGNPLGSHRGVHKMGMIYVSLRCFPPHFYSRLSNIFVYMVIPASANFYLSDILHRIVEDATELSNNGIHIGNSTYKFRLIGITGDNLGQHQLTGFVTGFTANFPCRVCRAPREVCQTSCSEDESLLRNEENYAEDVLINDVSRTGIKQDCVLNNIPDYHLTRNYIFDIMHDVLEGVANFGMCAVLLYYINEKVFSLEILNERIRLHSFGIHANRPPLVKFKNLEKDDLSYSASEMLNLVLHLSLIVGDVVPNDCMVWQYYLTLRKIVTILLLKSISESYINYLDVLISEHHSMYMNLFKRNLKPKHHFMLHYKRALLNTGPLCHNWAMRFESKNFQMKLFSQVIRSRVNLAKSIATRYAYLFANDLLGWRNNSSIPELEDMSPIYEEDGIGSCVKWVRYCGIRYEIGSVVCINSEHKFACHDMPVFGTINYIKIDQRSLLFIVNVFNTTRFCEHMAAYTLERNVDQYCCVHFSEISAALPIVNREGVTYVADMHF